MKTFWHSHSHNSSSFHNTYIGLQNRNMKLEKMKDKYLCSHEGVFKCSTFVTTTNSPEALKGGGQKVPTFFFFLLSFDLSYYPKDSNTCRFLCQQD